jgi:hypothetical protein
VREAMKPGLPAAATAPRTAGKEETAREFGGTFGAAFIMTLSHALMLYLWTAWRFYDGDPPPGGARHRTVQAKVRLGLGSLLRGSPVSTHPLRVLTFPPEPSGTGSRRDLGKNRRVSLR